MHSQAIIILFLFMSLILDRSAPSQLRRNGNLSPIRPREKMPTVYRHLQSPSREQLKEEGVRWPRDNSYLRKRLDRDIQLERTTMLIKTGRTSHDNPEWMSHSNHHYRREHHQPLHQTSALEERHFDVLNNPKQLYSGRNEDSYYVSMKEEAASPKALPETLRKTFTHFLAYQPQVTGKVGSSAFRDYSIPRPQLKVGSRSFVDTYSPF